MAEPVKKTFAWLRCAEGDWNFARIVGLFFSICQIIIIISVVFIKGLGSVNNGWQVLLCGLPIGGLCFLFAWEVIRGNKRLQIQVGNKNYSIGSASNETKAA